MKQKRIVPAFSSEAAEASWWDRNRSALDKDFLDAAKKRKLKRSGRAAVQDRLASRSRVISIRVPEGDLALAKEQATQRGLPYQTYIKSVLHQALKEAK